MTWDFPAELARHGPHAPWRGRPHAARAYCAGVTRRHPENFVVASAFVPRRLLADFHAVYAWCRWADDLADAAPPGADRVALLAWWRLELARCFAGTPAHPVTAAVARTVGRFGIPPGPFERLLAAFDRDQRVTAYATFDELLGYCRLSADPVGHLVLYLFGAFTPTTAALADCVCTGLQLANFWQDVARDHAAGRVYLPAADRASFGYPDADLAAGRCTPAFRALLAFEVARTRALFARGDALIPLLPRAARRQVGLFAAGGRAILDAIRAQDYDVWTRRPVVSRAAKARLLAAAAG